MPDIVILHSLLQNLQTYFHNRLKQASFGSVFPSFMFQALKT